jgi:hypothetical protein
MRGRRGHPAPTAPAHTGILELHRSAGNRAVAELLQSTRLAPGVQRACGPGCDCAGCRTSEDIEPVQRATVQRDPEPGQGNVLRHNGRWGTIDSPALLRLWAREAAMEMLWFGSTVRAIQEDPTRAQGLVEEVRPKLHRALQDPNRFTGSPEARRDAEEALDMQWQTPGQVREPILEQLTERYGRQMMQAFSHTPDGSDLVTRPEDFVRIRNTPYEERFWNGADVMTKGYTSGNREVVDIKGWGEWGNPSADPTADIWYILRRDWSWIYHTTGAVRPFDWHIGKVAGEVADNTKFAAELFPLLLKLGGFSLGLSSRLALIVASEIVTALGEQGLRSARGEQMQSAFEVATGIGLGIFVGAVTNRMFGHTESKLAGDLDNVAEQAAAKGRAEVAKTDAALVEKQLKAGEARTVTDPDLVSQGYRLEVEVASEGQMHTWRQQQNGWWCRFSEDPVCVTQINDAVDHVAAEERWRRSIERMADRRRSDPVWLAKDPASVQNVTSRELDMWADSFERQGLSEHPNFTEMKRHPKNRADIANTTPAPDKMARIEKEVAERKADGRLPHDFEYRPPAIPGAVVSHELVAKAMPVIGMKVSEHPAVAAAWQEAADFARAGRELTKENYEELYKTAAAKFWRIVGKKGSEARAFFERHGFKLDGKTSAHLPIEGLDRQEISLGLDHTFPKATGDNYRHALDGDKLEFLMQADNTKLSHLEKKMPDLRR